MRIDKIVREMIREKIMDQPSIQVEDVMELIRVFAGKPDVDKLREQEFRRTAHRLLSSFRDASGAREVVAANDKDGTFVVIECCEDVKLINAVLKQLYTKMSGIEKTHKKAERRRTVLQGQIHMDDIMVSANIVPPHGAFVDNPLQ